MSRPRYFDTHCHLQDPAFDDDRDAVIERAAAAGVAEIVIIASNPTDAERAGALRRGAADRAPRIESTAGLHPHEAGAWSSTVRSAIEAGIAAGAVAVGETGLDYHYDNSPRPAQRHAFAEQLGIAAERRLPVVVHSREAEDDTLALIDAATVPPEHVILHCFSGSRAMLEVAIERGYFISFSGMVTFRSFPAIELVPLVPADRLLAETDAPYLAPVPHRGRRNEPAYVVETVSALADLRGVETPVMAACTRSNGIRAYLGEPVDERL